MCKRFVNWKKTLVTLDQGYLTSVVSSYDTEGPFYCKLFINTCNIGYKNPGKLRKRITQRGHTERTHIRTPFGPRLGPVPTDRRQRLRQATVRLGHGDHYGATGLPLHSSELSR